MIKPGWNILRFIRSKMAQKETLRFIDFQAANMLGNEIHFTFVYEATKTPPKLLNDLSFLCQQKWWVDCLLEEHDSKLCIKGIKEIESQTQQELEFRAGEQRKCMPAN